MNVLLSLLSLLCTCSLTGAEKPNIIYILADDLGIGDLSCYGQQKFTTPHIDRLASEGMKFSNHYSGNTVCSPSRAVLMTGIHSGRNYLRGNVPSEDIAALPDELTVVPELLKKAGYRTGAFGKWGLGATDLDGIQNPLSHGFDEFCGWRSQLIAHTYYPTSYVQNGKVIPLDGETYLSPIVMQAARDFITESAQGGEPFFCYLPTAIPHAAMHAPKELHEKWRQVFPEFDKKIGKYTAGEGENTPDVVNPIAGFAAMMEHLDDEVGAILALVKKLGIDDNTLILFASDNGTHLEGGHNPKFWNSSGGLRGHKRDMHEGGIRSPFLARWPGKIEPGSESHLLSGFHDFLPTVAKLVTAPLPPENTGLSYLPTLLGKGDQKQHDYLYVEFTKGREQVLDSKALRFGKWKVFQNVAKKKPLELYDLESDPAEQNNLSKNKEHHKILQQAERYLEEASAPFGK